MRAGTFAASVVAYCFCAAMPPPTPIQAWKTGIEEQNRDYAQVPHAMLKIQGCAYLGDGQSAVLEGRKGDSESWHWSKHGNNRGDLAIALSSGTLTVAKNGKPIGRFDISRGIQVDKGVDVSGEATQVAAGVKGWRLFIFNQQNPAAKHFQGVSYFPYDPDYRVAAIFQADRSLFPKVFRTSRGTDKQFYHAGDARFELKGKSMSLPFYADTNRSPQIHDMTAFFTDNLTGHGAYSSGRYVDVQDFGNYPPSSVLIDFNTAYNPNCARSPCFTCPIAVDSMPIAIHAGEMDPHMKH